MSKPTPLTEVADQLDNASGAPKDADTETRTADSGLSSKLDRIRALNESAHDPDKRNKSIKSLVPLLSGASEDVSRLEGSRKLLGEPTKVPSSDALQPDSDETILADNETTVEGHTEKLAVNATESTGAKSAISLRDSIRAASCCERRTES